MSTFLIVVGVVSAVIVGDMWWRFMVRVCPPDPPPTEEELRYAYEVEVMRAVREARERARRTRERRWKW